MADVLLVDDDLDVAEGLTLLLELRGHGVRHAPDGHAGLSSLDERLPDVIVLDVEMPRLSGPEMAYQMLVRDAGCERVPVVLLSGVVNVDDIAKEVGTPYFLAKPFSIPAFERLLDKAVTERRAPSPPQRSRTERARGG